MITLYFKFEGQTDTDTHKQADGLDATKHIISLTSWSIMNSPLENEKTFFYLGLEHKKENYGIIIMILVYLHYLQIIKYSQP